jgi:hypothetical protein
MRRRARVEAAKRDQRRQQERKNTGHRVGGSGPVPGFAPRDAAAEATLRRITAGTSSVTEGCGTGTKAGARAAEDALLNGFRTQEHMDEANAIAIQQAEMELMTQDEEQVLVRTRRQLPPMSGGLEWNAVDGLTEKQPETALPVHTKSDASRLVPSKSAPPASRSSSYHPPSIPIQTKPSSSSAKAPTPSSNSRKPPVMATRPRHPVSRIVREAEEKQRQKKLLKKGPSGPSAQPVQSTSTSSPMTWQCGTCTLINEPSAYRCDACDHERPAQASRSGTRSIGIPPPVSNDNPFSNFKDMGWSCMSCGNYMEQKWWVCNICGWMKDHS